MGDNSCKQGDRVAAVSMQREIDKLSQSLARGDHSESALEKASKEIASYWDRVVEWFK